MTQIPYILLLLGVLAPPASPPERFPEHANSADASRPQPQLREGKLIQQTSPDQLAKQQRAQEQATAESGVNGFRSAQPLGTSQKTQIKPHLLNVNLIQSDPVLTKEQRTEYWQNKAETLQSQLDELQKIEKSMMNRE